ncbi:MAG: hypothetical protein LBN05_01385 [Oscillospiraceae bacterium]|jgi:hypothetical protein|nr:hypothetical protein [Oscillospiraceae bacterium]
MAKKVRYNDYPEPEELRRSTYTDFSTRFPGDGGKPHVNRETRERRQKALLTALAVTGSIGIIFVGFFVTLVLLGVSRNTPQVEVTDDLSAVTTPLTVPATTAPPVGLKNVHALAAPENALAGGKALTDFLNAAQKAQADTAIFTLKNPAGQLLYASQSAAAKKGNISKNTYANAKESVAAAKKASMHVVVQLSVFQDTLAPRALEDSSVRYAPNPKILWLDNSLQNGGKPWLNPFSKVARDYVLALIGELSGWDVDAIYLTAVQFPTGAQSQATFPGEDKADAPTRNAQLLSFIQDAKKAAGRRPLFVEMDAQAALQEVGAGIYGGDLWDSAADALVIPVRTEAEAKLVQTAAPKSRRWLPQFADTPKGETWAEFFARP